MTLTKGLYVVRDEIGRAYAAFTDCQIAMLRASLTGCRVYWELTTMTAIATEILER